MKISQTTNNGLFFCMVILLASCMAKPVYKKDTVPEAAVSNVFTINSPYDSVWTKVLIYSYKQNGTPSKKDKIEGTITTLIHNVPLDYMPDKKRNMVFNPLAVATSQSRERINNRQRLYPAIADIEVSFLLVKNNENTTTLVVKMADQCKVTAYYEQGYLVRRPLKTVRIWSTGLYEKQLLEELK